jgi:hypothetical protein
MAVRGRWLTEQERDAVARSLRRERERYRRHGRGASQNAGMAKRSYGTGQLYEKHGAYYGRWRTSDGRKLNRRVGAVRPTGARQALTRSQAERAFRQMQQDEEARPRPVDDARVTVGEAADSLRRRLALEGARKSYLVGCRSMQRVHIDPRLGSKPIADMTSADVEALASAMVAAGLKQKSVHNVLVFLHGVFEHALKQRWLHVNPVRGAARADAAARVTLTPTCSSSR